MLDKIMATMSKRVAKKIKKGGDLETIVIGYDQTGAQIIALGLVFQNEAEKCNVLDQTRATLRAAGCAAYAVSGESWLVLGTEHVADLKRKGLSVHTHPGRVEAVHIVVADAHDVLSRIWRKEGRKLVPVDITDMTNIAGDFTSLMMDEPTIRARQFSAGLIRPDGAVH